MSRCTGHCCKNFPLPIRAVDISQHIQTKRWHEIEKIGAMIIPLGVEHIYADGTVGERYTCKHLQPNGDCDDYANRPAMCSDYPYGRACDYVDKGCTYEAPIQIKSIMENVARHTRRGKL